MNPEIFREVVSTGFAQKRKTILNNLRHKYSNAESVLREAGVDPNRRAETLSLDEWAAIADRIDPAA